MVVEYEQEDARGILYEASGTIVFDGGLAPDIEITTATVMGLFIEHDYHGKLLPKVSIKLMLSQADRSILQRYKGCYVIELGITSAYTEFNSTSPLAEGQELFFGSYRAEMVDNSSLKDSPYTEEDGTRRDIPEGTPEAFTDAWFYLIDQAVLDLNKSRVDNSAPMIECTVADICAANMSAVAVQQELQFDEPDNTTVYEQVMITNKNLRNTIMKSVQEGPYGIYGTGVILYFDMNIAYLMSKWGENGKSDDEPEVVTINIESMNNVTQGGVVVVDEKNPIIIAPGSEYTLTKNAIVDELSSPTVIHYSSDSFNSNVKFNNDSEMWEAAQIISEMNYDAMTERSGTIPKKEYVFADNGNPYVIQSMHEEGRRRKKVQIKLQDSEASFFKPNLKYNICFDSTAEHDLFGGDYKLIHTVHAFFKSDIRGSLRCSTTANFK